MIFCVNQAGIKIFAIKELKISVIESKDKSSNTSIKCKQSNESFTVHYLHLAFCATRVIMWIKLNQLSVTTGLNI